MAILDYFKSLSIQVITRGLLLCALMTPLGT